MSAYVREPARAGGRLRDQPLVAKPRELRVDLAVARGPGVRERLLEVLEEPVPGPRAVGESAEECMPEGHTIYMIGLDMSVRT